jgi:cell division septation protein DedD
MKKNRPATDTRSDHIRQSPITSGLIRRAIRQLSERQSLVLAFLLFVLMAGAANAQSDTTTRTAGDSVVARARALATEGRDADSRKLLDSLLRVNTPDSAIYAEALYWRGALAATAADAERDYRRLLIEAPLSARAEDALLGLGNLLQARGDKRGASDQMQRFMLTYANSPARPRVALSLVRLLFDLGPQQQARACEALRMGRDAIPRENLELRNQLEYYEPRCMGDIAPAVAPESTAVAADTMKSAPSAADSAAALPPPSSTKAAPSRPSTQTQTPTQAAFYSVQVAAYQSKEPATNLASVLKERGLDARVDGTAAPFRVRVGKYSTRAEAVKAQASLKAQGQNGFITLVR